jgi:hypothetical protein
MYEDNYVFLDSKTVLPSAPSLLILSCHQFVRSITHYLIHSPFFIGYFGDASNQPI